MNEIKNTFQLRIYPDPFLLKKAKKVDFSDTETIQYIKSILPKMYQSMMQLDGIGLAATQMGIDFQFLVIKLDEKSEPEYFINPEIQFYSKKEVSYLEGCLSFPGIFGYVMRPEKIRLKYQLLDGSVVKRKLTPLQSRVIQHEIDHLNGNIFIDKIYEYIENGEEKLEALIKAYGAK